MDVAITRMSSKGQVVIPAEMRGDLLEGDKILMIQTEDHIIMKKASKMDKNLKSDLEFAKRTEKAWKRYEKGEFKSMDSKDFLKKLEKW
jgi:AbrB family looped-hinge helix DNA binding protein